MCKTIKQKVKFKAPPERVYRLLADSKSHSAFSGAKATVPKDLIPGIEKAWRNLYWEKMKDYLEKRVTGSSSAMDKRR